MLSRVGGPAADLADVEKRLARLERLARGLAKELALISGDQGPLLWLEKRAYLDALHRAWAGVEAARVALWRAVARLKGEAA